MLVIVLIYLLTVAGKVLLCLRLPGDTVDPENRR